jgi:hypothetical protein
MRNVADGLLAAESATLLGADRYERVVSLILFNVSQFRQSLWLTLTRGLPAPSETRTIARAELGAYEIITIRGVGMDPDTVLAGWASAAEAVAYSINQSIESEQGVPLSEKFQIERRDRTGAAKNEASLSAV